jgi:hypothetical protein
MQASTTQCTRYSDGIALIYESPPMPLLQACNVSAQTKSIKDSDFFFDYPVLILYTTTLQYQLYAAGTGSARDDLCLVGTMRECHKHTFADNRQTGFLEA